jgi:allophanate hydrolase
MTMSLNLEMNALRQRYLERSLNPLDMVTQLDAMLAEEEAAGGHNIWIRRLTLAEMQAYAQPLQARDAASLPLYGIPFVIKDNIDLAGVPTTAGCPAFAYTPERHAAVVARLIEAGAIPVGKANLDQFATGLVGARSPYGACRNSFDAAYVSGGSSSGSAVSVALGLASFSLGTDTAGSGRVPAAFNNLVGVKPTLGTLSGSGLVPACRTLDTISIFALTADNAAQVLAVAQGHDAADPYSRAPQPHGFDFGSAAAFRFGVPRADQLAFFGNEEGLPLFRAAVARLEALGGTAVEFDFAPFLETARLLYEGPWVAERYQAIRGFFDAHADALHPVTREITGNAARYNAADAFAALYRLKALQGTAGAAWREMDCFVTPTAGTHYRIDEVEADPIRLNSNLGYYTNFMNLLDLSAVAVPAGFQGNGLPFGITLVAPAFQDAPLLRLAARFHGGEGLTMGATGQPLPPAAPMPAFLSGQVRVAVCGAHLSGLPLNWQLTQRGARLVGEVSSAPDYKLYALPGGPPQRPGMVRVGPDAGGAAIAMEIWEMPAIAFGSFVAGIPAPLGIGSVTLADGGSVQGFVCEAHAAEGARDITGFGGWRDYLAATQ